MDKKEITYFCNIKTCNETDPDKFYYYLTSRCKRCHAQRTRENRRKKLLSLAEQHDHPETETTAHTPPAERTCSKCGETKPRDKFSSTVVTNWCNKCRSNHVNEHDKASRRRLKELEQERTSLIEQSLKDKSDTIEALHEQIRLLTLITNNKQ